ncbi:uncharacterized protein YdeI (YjbR/CyaY-like superfamily) [Glaciihabitans tibetensis]|uniref:Uncharacterized protein YdeI (YjbR/CyaY-like superfamily) n=1 Tax=Glaciihabitans tibetensis TaxID=1266600 RepID=A0A2T0VIE5_9MICO|nr:YdeI/OmpD-associated family protein [Glaciihabitans tibetensis]PRY69953.1 uncharacterized protein YdeI (YjbR/CyaY-like superfamily) [Glaciihabitans tibetensis]
MPFPDDAPRRHFEHENQWRDWLENNHATASGLFVVSWRASTGRPAIGYAKMVEQALCFGWVDSRQIRLDNERTMLWFTPRRPGSGWSRTNKERVQRLAESGQMRPAGQVAVTTAQADGSWEKLDSINNLELPPDLTGEFARHPGASTAFDEFPRSVRRGILEWIAAAKTPTTRARRIEETAMKAAKGERAHP